MLSNRTGGYAFNFHIMNLSLSTYLNLELNEVVLADNFTGEAQVSRPSQTPLTVDAADAGIEAHADDQPRTEFRPPTNIIIDGGARHSGSGFGPMSLASIPRHGSRATPLPATWPASSPLPGSVNIGFLDGHTESVKLDNLWQLYWHAGYEPPIKRPGLK
jgi:prepilin-type processing-associated H-X9-DG protein